MAYQVIIGRVAERDLLEIFNYIAGDNSDAARKFIGKLLEEAKSLATFPNRGGHCKERPGARFTVAGRYLIVYRVVEKSKQVRILQFWHSARERRHRN